MSESGKKRKYISKYVKLGEQAATLLAQGKSATAVAAMLGINRDTIYKWLQRPEFTALLHQKREAIIDALLEEIKRIGENSRQWQAYAWILERIYADRFSKREITVSSEEPRRIVIEWGNYTEAPTPHRQQEAERRE